MKQILLSLVMVLLLADRLEANAPADWDPVEWLLEKNECTGCDLCFADLRGSSLSFADLSRTNLKGADLSNADLTNANLSSANWIDGRTCAPVISIGKCFE